MLHKKNEMKWTKKAAKKETTNIQCTAMNCRNERSEEREKITQNHDEEKKLFATIQLEKN